MVAPLGLGAPPQQRQVQHGDKQQGAADLVITALHHSHPLSMRSSVCWPMARSRALMIFHMVPSSSCDQGRTIIFSCP